MIWNEEFETLSREALAALQSREATADAEDYRKMLAWLAGRVANASKEGDFLGFGGERVSVESVDVDELGTVAVGQAATHHALAAARQPDEHDIHDAAPQSSPPEPASSVPVKPEAPDGPTAFADRRAAPPATGVSAGTVMRDR